MNKDNRLMMEAYLNKPAVGTEDEINKVKADLNKDGKLSDYEKTRGAAIDKAMGGSGELAKDEEAEGRRVVHLSPDVKTALEEKGTWKVYVTRDGKFALVDTYANLIDSIHKSIEDLENHVRKTLPTPVESEELAPSAV